MARYTAGSRHIGKIVRGCRPRRRCSSLLAPARVYEFDPDDVDGETLSPDGTDVQYRAYGDHPSLITVRPHFIPQLLKIAIDI